MQSTGHSSTHARSSTSTHGSLITYVIARPLFFIFARRYFKRFSLYKQSPLEWVLGLLRDSGRMLLEAAPEVKAAISYGPARVPRVCGRCEPRLSYRRTECYLQDAAQAMPASRSR